MTPRRVLRWTFPALLIAAVLLAIRLTDGGQTEERDGLTFAAPDLAATLERGSGANARILRSFRDEAGITCRAILSGAISGIACRDRGGWHMRVLRGGVSLDDPAATARVEAQLRTAAAEMSAQ